MVGAAAVRDGAGQGGQWGPTLTVFAMASLLKLLVLAPGVYHSTDFEVSPCDPWRVTHTSTCYSHEVWSRPELGVSRRPRVCRSTAVAGGLEQGPV